MDHVPESVEALQKPAMRIFAYGSNMCTTRVVQRTPSARKLCIARLDGHCLQFHKQSIDGSSKANAFRTNAAGDRVWGVVFEIDPADEPKLDRAEGYGSGYLKGEVTVISGVGERIAATMYYADPSAVVEALLPYTWYKNLVVCGAHEHRLPDVYLAMLEEHDAIADPNHVREESNAAIARTAMWGSLWGDFRDRARRLAAGGQVRDAIDQTVAWQLRGDPVQVRQAIAHDALHLPELYSGSPWITAAIPAGARQGQWIALVCGNPSIAANGVHPTLGEWLGATGIGPLIETFDNRFAIGIRDVPLRHGRPSGHPVHWEGQPPVRVVQDTWRELECLIVDALADAGLAVSWPLGTVAALADAVPWKFKRWNPLPDPTKRALMAEGAPYLRWFLTGGASGGRPPGIVAFLGSCARRTARLLAPGLPIAEKVTHAPVQNLGVKRLIPRVNPYIIAGPHPVDGGGLFQRYRDDLRAALVAALT